MSVKHVLQNHLPDEANELSLVAPLSKAEAVALADAEAGRIDVDGRLTRLRSKRCKRSPYCRKFAIAIRPKGDLTKSLHAPADCGRFDCPTCERQWTIRQLVRAVGRLTCAELGSTAPRQDKLHVWTGPAEQWSAISKAIRRRSPECGRARIFQADSRCLAIAEQPFPGSSPVSVLTAVQLAADGIENAAHRMHAVRWLGRWDVEERSEEWEIIKHRKPLCEVKALAIELGAQVEEKRGRLGVWFRENAKPAAVARFWAFLNACPIPANETLFSRGTELDRELPDHYGEFLDGPRRASERYYAGAA